MKIEKENYNNSVLEYEDIIVDIRNTWYDFDARFLHWALPFEGERYSLVYFMHEASLLPQDNLEVNPQEYLTNLGVPWPK